MNDDPTPPPPGPVRRAVEAAGGCPDCNAERVLAEGEFGIWHLWVRHDPTCPTLAYLAEHGLTD